MKINKYLSIMGKLNHVEDEVTKIKNLMFEQIFLGGPSIGLSSPKTILKTSDWIKSWNKRDWLNFIELTSGVLGAIPSPASPLLLGISLGAGIANAKTYYDEDDPYTAGLYLAFSVIPAASLIKQLRGSKTFMKLGKDESMKVLEKIKTGTASSTEQKIAQNLVKEAAPVSDELGREVIKQTITKIISELPKKSLSFIIKLCVLMYRIGVFGLKSGITIGGTFLSYDLIYRALNYKNDKSLSSREKNDMVKLYNFILKNEDTIKNLSIEDIKKNETNILKNSNKFISIDTTHKIVFN